MKLLQVDTVAQAREKLKKALQGQEVKTLRIPVREALGKVLAEDVYAAEDVPGFDRSTVDGYAVRSADTSGASESLPTFLEITGEVEMGGAPAHGIGPGECMYIPTGGMLPLGADAVVMVEYCELFSDTEAAVYASVPSGRNIVRRGDDLRKGEAALLKGTALRPQEIGLLSALGRQTVETVKPWGITIISTGDELIPSDGEMSPGKVRDINTHCLQAAARKAGLEIRGSYVLRDERELLRRTVEEAMEESDIVVVSGGSSKGRKDETASVISELAGGELLTQGLALKPGKPTILGYDGATETILLGLPGHPAAAMIVFQLLIGWMWEDRSGQRPSWPVPASLTVNIPAAPGRAVCQTVRLVADGDGTRKAVPVFGRSGLISTLTEADGYIMIPENKEGLKKGETVDVFLL